MLVPQVLQHVRCDDLFARNQNGCPRRGSRHRWLYLFSSICVSTRLWLGGIVSTKRHGRTARLLAERVRRAALPGPLLVVFDGFSGYVKAFRFPVQTGQAGRPRLVGWSTLVLVQQVKQSKLVRLAHGSWPCFVRL